MYYIIYCDEGNPIEQSETIKIHKILQDLGVSSRIIYLSALDPTNLPSAKGLIIGGLTGTPDEKTWEELKHTFSFLMDAPYPVLGICFGHQIIGVLHGATVTTRKMIERKETIRFVTEDPLFIGIPNHSEFCELHHDHISLPEGFALLATSESSENEGMKHADKPLYGLQFHPEASGTQGIQIYRNFISMCEKHIY